MSRLKILSQHTLNVNPQSSEKLVDNKNKISETYNTLESKCLPFLHASLFATVLEDTLMELRILEECNNELRIIKIKSDLPLLLSLKYEVAQPSVVDELDGINLKNLNCNEYKLSKLAQDRIFVLASFMATYVNLIKSQSYEELQTNVNSFVNLDIYRINIYDEEAKNKIKRRELHKQIRQQRNHIKSVTYDTNVTIEDLRSKNEDASLYAEIRSRYIRNWQISHSEQLRQTIRDKESIPSGIIEYYKQRIDSEQRVHSEIEVLINIAINETLEKVDSWMNKYDDDMEGIDLKIQIKKNEYQDMLDQRIRLENTIQKHGDLIKDWIYFKEEREKLRQYREKMTKSAVIVQAWWRGLLVRLALGPYKVSKKKGAKKK